MNLLSTACVIFTAAIGAGCFIFQRFEPPTDIFLSPNGTYRIELRGDKGRASFFSLGNTVTAKIFVGQKVIGKTDVHAGDWMDSSFDLTYQKFRWHSERIFGMHGVPDHEPATAENGDSLTITNRSSKKATYLNVGFGINRFLILDLGSGDSQTVYTNHSMAPEWITGSAVFADGMEVRALGINFFENAKKKNERLFRYCLTVKDSQVIINSMDVEGENLDPSIVAARVAACGD